MTERDPDVLAAASDFDDALAAPVVIDEDVLERGETPGCCYSITYPTLRSLPAKLGSHPAGHPLAVILGRRST